MKETLLVIAAALCVLFILFQLVKGFLLARRFWKKHKSNGDPELEELFQKAETPAGARDVLREIDGRAAQNGALRRAVYYTAGGEIALTRLKRPNVAIRYYSRALRNNPKCEPAFDRLAEILVAQRRYRRFKHTCWYLLSRMNDDDSGSSIWRKCWSGLATVYASFPKSTGRADAIRKMLTAFAQATDDDLDGLDDEIDDRCDEQGCGCDNLPRIAK
ncbi:MAG: hypothetical protein JXX29_16365 [Deltaproteobacteria bacterium]|nr:hypothetical protein [Deltaproteobacteria bacterium]MBN2673258.1 hypothetical protein [Deltaproteobacteria bacterium]